MKKIFLGALVALFFIGCEQKANNQDAANTPPDLPGVGKPPVFKTE
ncbi:MAG: hypothetical protein OIF32_01835 [Campylobacterales bacterium]|nr:hypothetical protein [Campylobacterales bacterium]